MMKYTGSKGKNVMRLVAIVIVCSMIFVFFNMGTPPIEARYTRYVNPQVNISSKDLIGYEGNDSIYMSTGLSEASPSSVTGLGPLHVSIRNLSTKGSISNHTISRESYCGWNETYGVGLGIGAPQKGKDNLTLSEGEFFNSCTSNLWIGIPIVSMTHFLFNSSNPCLPSTYKGANIRPSTNVSFLVGGKGMSGINLCQFFSSCDKTYFYDGGHNVSLDYNQNSNKSALATYLSDASCVANGISFVSTLALPEMPELYIGSALLAYSLKTAAFALDDSSNNATVHARYINTSTCFMADQTFPSTGGNSEINCNTGFYSYNNLFFATEYARINIPLTDFGHTGIMNISTHDCCDNSSFGSTSMHLNVVPAVALVGEASLNGNPFPHGNVVIESSNGTGYEVQTNAKGYYRFMAKPNTNYTIYEMYDGSIITSSGVSIRTPDSESGMTQNIGIAVICFEGSESYPNTWYLEFNGNSYTMNSDEMRSFIVVANKSYAYSVGEVCCVTYSNGDKVFHCYKPDPSSGTVEGHCLVTIKFGENTHTETCSSGSGGGPTPPGGGGIKRTLPREEENFLPIIYPT